MSVNCVDILRLALLLCSCIPVIIIATVPCICWESVSKVYRRSHKKVLNCRKWVGGWDGGSLQRSSRPPSWILVLPAPPPPPVHNFLDLPLQDACIIARHACIIHPSYMNDFTRHTLVIISVNACYHLHIQRYTYMLSTQHTLEHMSVSFHSLSNAGYSKR